MRCRRRAGPALLVGGVLIDVLGDGAISGGRLAAQKARILLSLLLMSTATRSEIDKAFSIYG